VAVAGTSLAAGAWWVHVLRADMVAAAVAAVTTGAVAWCIANMERIETWVVKQAVAALAKVVGAKRAKALLQGKAKKKKNKEKKAQASKGSAAGDEGKDGAQPKSKRAPTPADLYYDPAWSAGQPIRRLKCIYQDGNRGGSELKFLRLAWVDPKKDLCVMCHQWSSRGARLGLKRVGDVACLIASRFEHWSATVRTVRWSVNACGCRRSQRSRRSCDWGLCLV